jgi:putative DNA primase/helicase
MNVETLPVEIRESTCAVVWRLETRDGRPTKVPYQPRRPRQRAAVDDPATWGTFAEALAVVAAGQAAGPGIVLGDGLVGVDLDHCRDFATGNVDAEARAIVAALDSYTEASPSGTGLHILARGTLPPGRRRRGHVELYDAARYFTVTGEHVAGTPTVLHERTAVLHALHRRLFPAAPPRPAPRIAAVDADDADIIERAHAARNGARFAALWRGDWSAYPSQSEGDLALCNVLARWTDGDAARVDRLFRQSGLMRAKWDTRRGSETYGARTVATAVTGCTRRRSA